MAAEEALPLLRPVPREQAILESFFAQLGVFSFDRAKDYVEKEKENSSRSSGAVWAALLAALAHLAAAEKAYHNMTFLGQKTGGQSFFSRKDSTRTIYTSLHNELRKVVTLGRHGQQQASSSAYLEELLCHLAEQLCHLAQARVDMADLYEKMHALAGQKNVNGEALAAALDAVMHKYSSKFHHPILGRVEESFQTEVEVVTQLLRCQAQVSEWRFLPALLSLHGAAVKLTAWGQLFQRQKETRKHLFGGQSQRSVQPPHLYAWLQRFQAALLAKFSFYFHEALSRQTAPADMRALTARAAPDYHGKICSFVRRHDGASVSLVFDNRGSESFQGHGYHHPRSYREPPKGVEQFPAVVSLPSGERPLTHWPNVVMMMGDRAAELDAPDKVVHFYDDKVQSTYYLARPEPHFTLVVILDSRKSDRDLNVVAFLQEICGALRNSKPFATLKPGSKG
ncbi:KICSTOR subunit 2 isoform X1 [Hippocampus zosterae]|uniref:KICSTOR subunit 2 isoform X1 n=1 Tax=Hippocampus zosterae TaxID=109293 RepID=UPI00223D463E|nr:KICSTOR subunit 2 isoform X1 [Hippocampus zosterae]XP_051911872.1 KICSTOR subunit 2 isoform X1 [Hippocampus zosterae]XP_051911873.1 KICSTOR subunit 2 isoform X1 [Hippocampus zosterae]